MIQQAETTQDDARQPRRCPELTHWMFIVPDAWTKGFYPAGMALICRVIRRGEKPIVGMGYVVEAKGGFRATARIAEVGSEELSFDVLISDGPLRVRMQWDEIARLSEIFSGVRPLGTIPAPAIKGDGGDTRSSFSKEELIALFGDSEEEVDAAVAFGLARMSD